jgi:hypothetical protein
MQAIGSLRFALVFSHRSESMQHSAAMAGTILLSCSTCLISVEAAARPRSHHHVAALGHIDGRSIVCGRGDIPVRVLDP